MTWRRVKATVSKGHGVASGASGDPRFPQGTLGLQFPYFRAQGLDLNGYHPGTLNLSIAPRRYTVLEPGLTLRALKWHPDMPAEDFSFFDCRLTTPDGQVYRGHVYYPHPDTKPEHFQPPDVLEVLAPRIEGLRYGLEVELELPEAQIRID